MRSTTRHAIRSRVAIPSLALALSVLSPEEARAVEGRIPLFEPTTITAPGSYRVTRDISATSGSVFTIDANDVFIDLDGHKLDTATADPVIKNVAARTGLRISNGTIIGGTKGVYFSNAASNPPIVVKIDHLILIGQATAAIDVSGVTMGGVVVVIENNTIDGGSATGPVLDEGILVQVVTDSSISNNVVRGCELFGIHLKFGGQNRVVGNTASGTGSGANGVGIWLEATSGNFVTDNVGSQNRITGIKVTGNFNSVTRNTFSAAPGNGAGTGDGIFIDGDGNTISYNTCSGNSNKGISLPPGGDKNTVDENVASMNGSCGIDCQGAGNIVSQNHTSNNGGGCTITQEMVCRGPGPAPQVAAPGINAAGGNLVCGNIGI